MNIPFPPPAIVGTAGNAIITALTGHYFVIAQVVNGQTPILPNYYGTLPQADAYFYNRLHNQVWFDANIQEREKALKESTQTIDMLNFAGQKVNSTQLHEFPRKTVVLERNIIGDPITGVTDTIVPWQIIIACYEIAYKLLDGFNAEIEYENLAHVSQGFASARTTYDRTFAMEHILAGIPSLKAWKLLKPFVKCAKTVTLSRVD